MRINITYRRCCFFLATILPLLLFQFTRAPLSLGASTESTVTLLASQSKLNRLASGDTSGETRFSVDADAKKIVIEIISPVELVNTSILSPNGQLVDSGNIITLQGTYSDFAGNPGSDSPLILPTSSPGYHYLYVIPALGGGAYTVNYAIPAPFPHDIPIMVQLTTDSPIAARLFVTEERLPIGTPAVLGLALFHGASPILGVSPRVVAVAEDGTRFEAPMLDNGMEADKVQGDGLYTAQFDVVSAGKYVAVATVSGATGSGIPFERESTTGFEILASTGNLTGTFKDTGVDADGNGQLDSVTIDLDVTADQPGEYQAFIYLKSAGGESCVMSGVKTLSQGTGSIAVDFDVETLRKLNENGPYSIEQAELFYQKPEGKDLADRMLDLGLTKNYQLSQFERPPIAVVGNVSETTSDTNVNGLYDTLTAYFDVDVRTGGYYEWSARLTDVRNIQIALGSASGTLDEGRNRIGVTFKGSDIGNKALNGPFYLQDLLIYGNGNSLALAGSFGSTGAYKYYQFEGASKQGDLDGDGDVDQNDINILLMDRNKSIADSVCGNRCDLDEDGAITSLDARKLSLMCTRARCATQ